MKLKYLATASLIAACAQLSLVGCTKGGQMNTETKKSDTEAPAVGQVGSPGEARPAEAVPKDSADASKDLQAAQPVGSTPVTAPTATPAAK